MIEKRRRCLPLQVEAIKFQHPTDMRDDRALLFLSTKSSATGIDYLNKTASILHVAQVLPPPTLSIETELSNKLRSNRFHINFYLEKQTLPRQFTMLQQEVMPCTLHSSRQYHCASLARKQAKLQKHKLSSGNASRQGWAQQPHEQTATVAMPMTTTINNSLTSPKEKAARFEQLAKPW